MLLRHILAIGLSLSISHAAAQSKTLDLHKGRSFEDVRRELLKQGWKPMESFDRMGDGCRFNQSGPARRLYNMGFKEVQICSEGNVYCWFNYTRRNQCLRLITEGERNLRLHFSEYECYEPISDDYDKANPKAICPESDQ